MDTLNREVSARDLRSTLADTLSSVAFGHERIGVTRNGKLTAVLIDAEDFALLERLEAAADVAAYDDAKAGDDGTRIPLDDVVADLGL